jgi:hypothetical protein
MREQTGLPEGTRSFSPAVSFVQTLRDEITWRHASAYAVTQIAGLLRRDVPGACLTDVPRFVLPQFAGAHLGLGTELVSLRHSQEPSENIQRISRH